jgi:hypothetical protein
MQQDDILDNFDDDIRYLLSSDEPSDVVARYLVPTEAEIAAAYLRSEGIPCFLSNSVMQSVTPHLSAEIRLHVRPADLEKARTLLSEQMDQQGSEEEKEAPFTFFQALLTVLAIIAGVVMAILLFGMG